MYETTGDVAGDMAGVVDELAKLYQSSKIKESLQVLEHPLWHPHDKLCEFDHMEYLLNEK